MNYYFEDFTESSYHDLLILAKKKYSFLRYTEYKSNGKNVLWRHDIDCSVHRAYSLAKIEAEMGIYSTFFIHLHNEFYNALELEIVELINKIISLGHDIGLHFDPFFFGLYTNEYLKLEKYLILEKEILESIFQKPIHVFSFHNPTVGGNWLEVDQEQISGMINTYSKYLKHNYEYCSDSNGYWKSRRLKDILLEGKDEKLQILTHPCWWTPESMSPRDRITRCINGRAVKINYKYDNLLKTYGRENVK